MLPSIFDAFVKASPVSVMARGVMERFLNPDCLNAWFEEVSDKQYNRDLLFSTLFDLLSQVVCGSHKSVHAAYQASPEDIGVSVVAVYDKLKRMEPQTSAALVRYAASQATPLIEALDGAQEPLLPGYRVKLLDGNCLAASEHRIKELRGISSGPLPGKSLVVLDPSLRMPIDVFPCEDGHTQERALLNDVLETVEANDLWIADRNFCTRGFLNGIAEHEGYFIIRQHANLPTEILTPQSQVGATETGRLYEQTVQITTQGGIVLPLRRIRVQLKSATRDGDRNIYILTNLPKRVNARKIAELYRERWTIETAFQDLTVHLRCEINTLGYPPAALLGFCVALIAYITFAILKAALQHVHGAEKIQEEFSGYYLADELGAVYRGMLIAVPAQEWIIFRDMPSAHFVDLLIDLAREVNMRRFKKHPRKAKKKQPPRKKKSDQPHVSTARILAKRGSEKSGSTS